MVSQVLLKSLLLNYQMFPGLNLKWNHCSHQSARPKLTAGSKRQAADEGGSEGNGTVDYFWNVSCFSRSIFSSVIKKRGVCLRAVGLGRLPSPEFVWPLINEAYTPLKLICKNPVSAATVRHTLAMFSRYGQCVGKLTAPWRLCALVGCNYSFYAEGGEKLYNL